MKNLYPRTWLLFLLALLSTNPLALSAAINYEPYAFTTFAGFVASQGSADGTGGEARFDYPTGIAMDSSGDIYVGDDWATVRKITPAGTVTTLAGKAPITGKDDGEGSAARFNGPFGLATDPSGNIYVADMGNHTIRKITPTGLVTTIAGLAGTSGTADGQGTTARFKSPYAIAADSSGNLYVADSGNNTIRKIRPDGIVTTFAGVAGTSGKTDGMGSTARFYQPFGIATDSSGIIYVSDSGNHIIRKITPQGFVTTLAGLGKNPGSADGTGTEARFYAPGGLATDPYGNV
jgi:streptogramin lyase